MRNQKPLSAAEIDRKIIGVQVMAWETFQIVKLAKLRKAVSSGNT